MKPYKKQQKRDSKSAKIENVVLPSRRLNTTGPTRIPDKIYPIINGCFKRRVIKATAKTIKKN
jgi:hypothetical protein